MGHALYVAQQGGKHRDAKPLKGFGGAGVLEIVSDFDGDTFRGRLHRSARGLGLCPSRVSEEIQEWARNIKDRHGTNRKSVARCRANCERRSRMKRKIAFERGSGNVFADIDLPNASEHLIKAELVFKIDRLLKSKKLKQVEAAKLFGVKQPDVSKMLRGDFRQFSVERLMRFLVALGQDVEIVVKPHRGELGEAQLRVA
jgi:predicted XRE-type DNA-binding protein